LGRNFLTQLPAKAMKHFEVEDVLGLLRRRIDRAGGQSELARQTGLERADINRALNGRRLPMTKLCLAIGLEWVVVRQVAGKRSWTKSDILCNREVLGISGEAVKKAGGPTAWWSRQTGINRTYLSLVLHERKNPGKRILAALALTELLVRADDSRSDFRKDTSPKNRLPHARWK
jgi:DNA-binding phage protein/lambda repressor-like predicted transcriptional regulator